MASKINEQRELMHQALSLLDDLDTLERLIKPVDNITYKVMRDESLKAYSETCSKLFLNFLTINHELQQ